METVAELSAPSAPRDPRLQPGRALGSYRLIRTLGEGSFGHVWEAEDTESGRLLALKLLTSMGSASPTALGRFEREGRIAASLNHPRCVYVFAADVADGIPFIAQELVPGGTLRDLIEGQDPLPEQQAVDLILDVITGLEVAQKAGILHRDIKPSNCFLDEEGRAKIGDFGISRTLEEETRLTATGTFIGTPVYSSPEQARGRDLDVRSDIYSVGATLYTLLAGVPPFFGKSGPEVIARILSEAPAPISSHRIGGSKGLQRLVMRCLAKDKRQRFANYAALRAALIPFSSQGLEASSLAKRALAYVADWLTLFVLTLSHSSLTEGDPFDPPAWPAILLYLLYFSLFEGKWGRSPGKFLAGLRVATPTGLPITPGAALIRSLNFVGVTTIPPTLVHKYLMATGEVGNIHALIVVAVLALSYLAVISTMRKRNGYAGLHELASKTRVFAVRRREEAAVPDALVAQKLAEELEPVRFGPYRRIGTIWERGREGEQDWEALLLGRDGILERDVWIHAFGDATQAAAVGRLASTSPGRLAWLQGSRQPADVWDAYGPPSGTALISLVTRKKKLSWALTRRLLLSLSEEIKAQMGQGWLPRPMSLDHIWLDASGNAKLLDFPAPVDPADGIDEKGIQLDADNWKAFLHQLLLFAMEGKAIPLDRLDSRFPRAPLPETAKPLIQTICKPQTNSDSLEEIIGKLQQLTQQPATVGRLARLGSFAIIAGPVMVVTWLTLVPLPEDTQLVIMSEYVETLMEIYRSTVPGLYRQERIPTATISFLLSFFAVPALILSFVLRGGPLLYLFGAAVQTLDGRRASRWRCLMRALAGWGVFLLYPQGPLVGPLGIQLPEPGMHAVGMALVVLALVAVGYAIRKPDRGLPDRIAGTVLVPWRRRAGRDGKGSASDRGGG